MCDEGVWLVCSEGVVGVVWCVVRVWLSEGVVKGYGVMCPCAPYMYTLSW